VCGGGGGGGGVFGGVGVAGSWVAWMVWSCEVRLLGCLDLRRGGRVDYAEHARGHSTIQRVDETTRVGIKITV